MQLLRWDTEEVIFEADCQTIAQLVRDAKAAGADLTSVGLRRANLKDVDLRDVDLKDADLAGADLRNADLAGANLRDANLRRANLTDANLTEADLTEANLRGADLAGADLTGADLTDANLKDTNLKDTDLTDANLWGVIGNLARLKTMQLDTYPIAFTKEILQISWENHPIEDWRGFSDADLLNMGGPKALRFWNKWKHIIFQVIDTK